MHYIHIKVKLFYGRNPKETNDSYQQKNKVSWS
jgi:hypothetical protein